MSLKHLAAFQHMILYMCTHSFLDINSNFWTGKAPILQAMFIDEASCVYDVKKAEVLMEIFQAV